MINLPKDFSKINWDRNRNGFPDWAKRDDSYWLIALMEELGEIAGAIKKLKRGMNDREFKKVREKYPDKEGVIYSKVDLESLWYRDKHDAIKSEMADILTYLDLFSTSRGYEIGEAAKMKFNQVSDEMNLPQFKIE